MAPAKEPELSSAVIRKNPGVDDRNTSMPGSPNSSPISSANTRKASKKEAMKRLEKTFRPLPMKVRMHRIDSI